MICIDVSPAVHRKAGLGRYAEELVSALQVQAGSQARTRYSVPFPRCGGGTEYRICGATAANKNRSTDLSMAIAGAIGATIELESKRPIR